MEPIFSFSRHAWMSAHTILGVLFTAATVLHAIFNRRILLNYVRGRAAIPGAGREAVGAVVLVAVMLFCRSGPRVSLGVPWRSRTDGNHTRRIHADQ